MGDRSVHATAPIRACDLGGWTDTWFAGHGAVLNVAVTPLVEVRIDVHRRTRPTVEVPELSHEDARPAYEDLGELTDGLPPKERAAVVLRYGYDLPYAEIGAALGSSEEAARAAASSGVRRLRRELDHA